MQNHQKMKVLRFIHVYESARALQAKSPSRDIGGQRRIQRMIAVAGPERSGSGMGRASAKKDHFRSYRSFFRHLALRLLGFSSYR
jgi:hypothetical protein